MTFDPEAYFADVKTWPPVVERTKPDASPWKVYPAWETAYCDEWEEPRCDCGALAMREGLHLCEACK